MVNSSFSNFHAVLLRKSVLYWTEQDETVTMQNAVPEGSDMFLRSYCIAGVFVGRNTVPFLSMPFVAGVTPLQIESFPKETCERWGKKRAAG
jgi:hypothetical protein